MDQLSFGIHGRRVLGRSKCGNGRRHEPSALFVCPLRSVRLRHSAVHRHYRHTARTAQYIIQLITQGSVGNRNRWLAARYCISKVWSLAFQPIPREVYGLAVIRSFDVHQRRATRVLDSRRRIINPAASSLCSVLLGVASSLAQGKLLHFHHRV